MRIVLLSLLVLGAGGCAKHGVDAVKDMRAHACAGDAAGFLERVDRKEFTRSTRAQWEKKAEASIAKLDPGEQAAERAKFQRGADQAVATAVEDTFVAWASDIKRGSGSDVCQMSVLESSEVDNTADVHVRTPVMRDQHWTMVRHGDRWSLVRVDN
jgi:hypothetical protein